MDSTKGIMAGLALVVVVGIAGALIFSGGDDDTATEAEFAAFEPGDEQPTPPQTDDDLALVPQAGDGATEVKLAAGNANDELNRTGPANFVDRYKVDPRPRNERAETLAAISPMIRDCHRQVTAGHDVGSDTFDVQLILENDESGREAVVTRAELSGDVGEDFVAQIQRCLTEQTSGLRFPKLAQSPLDIQERVTGGEVVTSKNESADAGTDAHE